MDLKSECILVGDMLCTSILVLYHHMHPVDQGDLKSLHSELHPVADKWYFLGVQLQVPIETLKCIRKENLSVSECLLEMLIVWLKCTNPPSTWNILIEALESPPVGETLLAQQLRDKYCPRKEAVTYGYATQRPSLPATLTASQGYSIYELLLECCWYCP